MTENLPAKTSTATKLLGRLSTKYGVEPDKLLTVLRDTAFKTGPKEDSFSDTELAAALILAEKYDLNPFIRQIYITRSHGVLLPIIPIDGWAKIVTSQKDFDGVEFTWDGEGNGLSCTCKMYHRGRSRPTAVTEFLEECRQNTDPWKKWPRRMLRHKAYIQCARLAFALSDAIDDDDAARYVDVKPIDSRPSRTREMTLPRAKDVETTEEIVEQTSSGVAVETQPPAEAACENQEDPREDPQRAGLKKTFIRAWQRHEAANTDPVALFGVTDDAADTLSIPDLIDLVAIMNESITEMGS